MEKEIKKSEGKEKLFIVMTSGGRTSMFLAKYMKENQNYKNVLFVFLNTGKEKEETLKFIDDCDNRWELNIIWLEAKIIKEKGIGTTYKIVDYNNASRNGEPFEDMLFKYPLPNNMASNCTRELKQRPIESYIRENFNDFDVYRIIGIRADEEHRKSNTAKKDNIIYPLCDDLRVDQKFIRKWWDMQSFDLQLKDYEGNCDLCFKKSLNKRLTIIKENPSVADWWEKMENKYSSEAIPRFDLRTNKSVTEMKELAKRPFQKAEDLHELSKLQCDLFDYETDCFCKAN